MVRKAVGKNAINENQYKNAGSGRWVVVGDGVKVEIALPWQGQIWRLPYLVAKRLEMTVYFIKNAINENQYKSAGFGS